MKEASKNINRLLPVLEMVFQAEQIKMAQVNLRIEDLQFQLRQIERPSSTSDCHISPAEKAGADMLWQSWAEDRRTLINQELAHAMRDKEQVRSSMKQALSKREAAKQIAAHTSREAVQRLARRSSW